MKTYDLVSKINHWSIAIAFIGMLSAGLVLEYAELSKPNYFMLLKYHKATGVVLLIWAVWRVGYRLRQGFINAQSGTPKWQHISSQAVHYLLLIATITMPVSGLAMALYSGFPTDIFGLFTISPLGKIETVSALARDIHKWSAYSLIILIVLHVSAALKHHFINKDNTIIRMLKG